LSTLSSVRPDFADAYDEHVFQVYGFFAYRVRSRTEAEDLTQLAFERALRAFGRFDPSRASFGTWIMSIARNLLIDHYRSDRTGGERPIEEGEDWEGPDEGDRHLGVSPELERALATLGEREREIIALRFGGDLTGQQIADLTGLTLANVQQLLSRSLRRLKGQLESGPATAPASSSSAPEPP
jgi:RNA polymerase sigma-70 factor (ECF subfamily)